LIKLTVLSPQTTRAGANFLAAARIRFLKHSTDRFGPSKLRLNGSRRLLWENRTFSDWEFRRVRQRNFQAIPKRMFYMSYLPSFFSSVRVLSSLFLIRPALDEDLQIRVRIGFRRWCLGLIIRIMFELSQMLCSVFTLILTFLVLQCSREKVRTPAHRFSLSFENADISNGWMNDRKSSISGHKYWLAVSNVRFPSFYLRSLS
jgi:hypothetical protein